MTGADLSQLNGRDLDVAIAQAEYRASEELDHVGYMQGSEWDGDGSFAAAKRALVSAVEARCREETRDLVDAARRYNEAKAEYDALPNPDPDIQRLAAKFYAADVALDALRDAAAALNRPTDVHLGGGSA